MKLKEKMIDWTKNDNEDKIWCEVNKHLNSTKGK